MSKAVIFTKFSRMAKILHRELEKWNPLLITGDVTGQDRSMIIEKFNRDDSYTILISTDAGSEGVSYAAADFIFHFDLPYSYGKYIQRNGRIVLLGKTRPIAIFNLVARRSMDEHIAKIIARKQDLSDVLLGSKIQDLLA